MLSDEELARLEALAAASVPGTGARIEDLTLLVESRTAIPALVADVRALRHSIAEREEKRLGEHLIHPANGWKTLPSPIALRIFLPRCAVGDRVRVLISDGLAGSPPMTQELLVGDINRAGGACHCCAPWGDVIAHMREGVNHAI